MLSSAAVLNARIQSGSSQDSKRLAHVSPEGLPLKERFTFALTGQSLIKHDIRDITEEQLLRTFQTNIFGMFYLVQAALPHLGEGSAIINCTSVTMYQGSKELLDYSSTKGAITAFTRSLSENLIGKGIRVNAVAPGPIWTPLNPSGGASPEKLENFGEDTPMGRPGQPNEVAPSFLFLACEDSSYMSGQVLHPNGGTIVNGGIGGSSGTPGPGLP